MISPLELGYSFCPNDTFIFYALTHGKVPSPLPIREMLEDVETLNEWALKRRLPLTKLSYRAYFEVIEDYVALRSGGALGRGVGPLIVTKGVKNSLEGCTVASPGRLTTAELLLKLSQPSVEVVHMRYDLIMPAVERGEVDAGLIIHESRFTYQNHGLSKFADLGQWWEADTGLPLPLGAILVRRDLAPLLQQNLDQAVRSSLEYAYAHREEPRAYIREHALEMEDSVMQAHIDLYVNEFSLDVGELGEQAVKTLYERARALGVVSSSSQDLFVAR